MKQYSLLNGDYTVSRLALRLWLPLLFIPAGAHGPEKDLSLMAYPHLLLPLCWAIDGTAAILALHTTCTMCPLLTVPAVQCIYFLLRTSLFVIFYVEQVCRSHLVHARNKEQSESCMHMPHLQCSTSYSAVHM